MKTAALVWNGYLHPRVGADQLPEPTLGEGWVIDGGVWKLQSYGPGPAGPASVPLGEPHLHPGSVGGPMMGGGIAPVPAPSGGSGGTLPPSGYPASSAPPVPAGALGLTDATVYPAGSSVATVHTGGGGWPYYGYGWPYYGYGYGWPWYSAGWGWPYDLQWLSTAPYPKVPTPPELYDPPISGEDRYRYCKRVYKRYCRKYPKAPYCGTWRWFCEPFM